MSALFDLVRALIDGAGQVPILVWIAIIAIGVLVWLAYEIATAPLITDEEREEIARAHRELRGARGMPSTRSTAPAPTGGTSTRHPATRGQAATAHGRGRPRRDR